MPTFQVTLKYKVIVSDTSGRAKADPATPTPLIAVYVNFRGRDYLIGNVSLSQLRLLTGTSTEYNALVAETTVTNATPAVITDTTYDNEEFVAWAGLLPESSFTPFLSAMHK